MTVPSRLIPSVDLDRPLTDKEGRLTDAGRTLLRSVNHALSLLNGELPVYADNAAALAGGLTAGRWYVTSSGAVRIVV